VAVDRRRVGALDARRKVGRARRDAREQTECAVDVHPAVVLAGNIDHFLHGIEFSPVHFAGIDDDDSRLAVECFERAAIGIQVQAAERIGRELPHVSAADTLQCQHSQGAGMHEAGSENGHLRQPDEARFRYVDAVLFSPPLARRGETDEVGHRGARHHDARPARRQTEQFLQPVECLQLHVHACG